MAVRSREWPGCGGSGDPLEFLLKERLVSPESIEAARDAGGDPLEWLLYRGYIGERDATRARAHGKGIPFADLDRSMALFEAYHLPPAEAWQIGALPLRFLFDRLFVAFRDPYDSAAVRAAERLTGKEVIPVATPPSRLDEILNEAFAEPDRYLGIAMVRGGLEVLLRKGFVTDEQIRSVAGRDDPVQALLDADVIGEREFALARAWDCELLFLDTDWNDPHPDPDPDPDPDPEVVASLPIDLARTLGILPIRRDKAYGDRLKVAMRDPRDLVAIMRAEQAAGCRVVPFLILRASAIARALDRWE